MTELLQFHFSLSCIGEGNGTHSSVLAWRIPGTGKPGGLPSMEESIGRILNDINQSKILYDSPPKVMEIKTKVNKWDLIKLKTFAQQRKL